MLASVLKSKRAVEMSIRVVRVFIQLREMLAHNKELAIRIEKLETGHRQHASALSTIVDEIRRLMKAPVMRKKKGADRFCGADPVEGMRSQTVIAYRVVR